jgi:signal transduction histidine kinase
METYEITPAVDAVREFLEIAGDFTNPLEVIREAISNAIDAGASEIKINFSQPKAVGGYVLTITIEDDGRGMDAQDLQSFFDLGNSAKRHDPNLIGEKGHGTKVYFNSGLQETG